jgi:phosphatidylinositol glycan class C protein
VPTSPIGNSNASHTFSSSLLPNVPAAANAGSDPPLGAHDAAEKLSSSGSETFQENTTPLAVIGRAAWPASAPGPSGYQSHGAFRRGVSPLPFLPPPTVADPARSHPTTGNNNGARRPSSMRGADASLSTLPTSGPASPALVAAAPVWRKVLYEKQPFEDNYVDSAFMQHLRTNENLHTAEFRQILRATFAILQQINLAVLFTVIYAASLQGVISPFTLVIIDVVLMFVALVGYVAITNGSFSFSTLFEPAKKTFTVTGVLLLLSPVFHTLTRSFTDDTIWALSILLGFIHVVCADYDYLNAQSADYTHNLSMNAAIVAVTLLASRVANPVAAAAVIGVGILVFTLSPIMRHHIRLASVEAHESSSLILCGIAIGCLVQMHPIVAGVFVLVVLVLTVAMPLFFVRVQSGRYKIQIQGPWDEAKPRNSAAAAEWANAGLLS